MRRPILYFLFLGVAALLFGCFNPRQSLTQTDPPAVEDASVPSDSASASPVDLRAIAFDEDFFSLPDSAKLDEAAVLLETAQGYLEDEQFVTAGYSFALARMMLASVNAESLTGENREFYNDLVADVGRFFDGYVAGKSELPEESPPGAIIAGVEEAEGDTIAEPEDILGIVRGEVDTTSLAEALRYTPNLPPVILERNRQVENAIKFFQTKGRKVYTRWLKRAETVVPMMTEIIREEKMPEELVYVSMIESGFNNTAYSFAHASGPWQFIRSTGVIFGLESSYWIDERRDPAKATQAACRYLRKLYRDFGDWNLAIAGYNCGEKNVERQIKRSGSRDFFKLTRLPRETRNYVPTYIAAAIIARDPAAYGFEPPVYRAMDPVDSALVTEMVDLKLAASLVGTDYQTLKQLNPSLIRWATPPNDSTWLILPDGTADKFITGWAAIPEDQKRSQTIHIVRKGETLGKIAAKYGVTLADIRGVAENKKVKPNRLVVGQEIVIPVAPDDYKKNTAEYKIAEAPPKQEKIVYKVRKGDTLSSISQKFGTTVSAIKRNNNLYKSNKIYVGQNLVIRSSRSAEAPPTVSEPEAKEMPHAPIRPATHTVKKGENLSAIAAKYGVSLKALQNANNIAKASSLKAGATLKIPVEDAGEAEPNLPVIYSVKRGDTITKIARKHGVSEADLLKANDLNRNSVIHPGDKLKIP